MIPITVETLVDEETGKESALLNFRQWREHAMLHFDNWKTISNFLKLTPEYGKKDVTMMKLIDNIDKIVLSGVLLTTTLFDEILVDPKFETFISKLKEQAAENVRRIKEELETEKERADYIPDEIKEKMAPGGSA